MRFLAELVEWEDFRGVDSCLVDEVKRTSLVMNGVGLFCFARCCRRPLLASTGVTRRDFRWAPVAFLSGKKMRRRLMGLMRYMVWWWWKWV